MALARAHLIAGAAWYTARIWGRIDTTTISVLLAQWAAELDRCGIVGTGSRRED